MTDLWRAPALADLPWLTHGVTLRTGGVSVGPYESLNLGLHVGDDPARVRANRSRAAESLGFGLDAMICAEQVHRSAVEVVGAAERGRGSTGLGNAIPGADALATDTPGVLLALFYADCLPVLFADSVHRAVAVAHAGWRGLVGGVIENTLTTMREAFGTNPADVSAAIGPGIGPCCFEVGSEVAAHFLPEFVTPGAGGANLRVDLAAEAARRLAASGVLSANVSACSECTSCVPAHWFSHRRDQGRTGRMGALIGIRSTGFQPVERLT